MKNGTSYNDSDLKDRWCNTEVPAADALVGGRLAELFNKIKN